MKFRRIFKNLLAFVLICLLSTLGGIFETPYVWAAGSIARDNSVDSGGFSSSATVNYSFTITGTNPLIVCTTFGSDSSDSITSVTYNGVNLNKIASIRTPVNERFSTLWYLLNPATGSHTVSVNGDTNGQASECVSYTGVLQSGQPDNSTTNTATAASSVTTSLTPAANGTWIVLGLRANNGSDPSAGAGATVVQHNSAGIGLFDTNGPVSPPASYSMTINGAALSGYGVVMASFSPISFGPTTSAGEYMRMSFGY